MLDCQTWGNELDCGQYLRMRLIKVYLNVYDFMAGNGCLEGVGLGAYHSAVEIDDQEYCFCVVSTDPRESGVIMMEPESAGYRFNRKIFLGEAEMMDYRFHQIVQEMSEQFTCGRYHMFSYNCNHFAREFASKLINIEVPAWLFRATDILAALSCCLPRRLVNGQWALETLIREHEEEEKRGLVQ